MCNIILNMSVIKILSMLMILLLQIIIIECTATTRSLDGFKESQNPFLFLLSSPTPSIRSGIGKKLNNFGKNNTFNTSKTPKTQGKKWQVGRVSRKHYEIVNMLWRKTNIFFDEDTTAEHYYPIQGNDSGKFTDSIALIQELHTVLPSPILLASTPSFIEFYYLDETDDARELTSPKFVKYYTTNKNKRTNRNNGNSKFALLNPVFAFYVNPIVKSSALPTRHMRPTIKMHHRKLRTFKTPFHVFQSTTSPTQPHKFPHKVKLQSEVTATIIPNSREKLQINATARRLNSSTTENIFDNETCPYTTEVLNADNKSTETSNTTLYATQPTQLANGTFYDKIKFFEMYDKNTYAPNYDFRKSVNTYNIELIANSNVLNDNTKILLEHVDQNIGHDHDNSHKTKHAKKHIIENNKDGVLDSENLIEKKLHLRPVIFKATNKTTVTIMKEPLNCITKAGMQSPTTLQYNMSTFATWSEYSFVAVYVYEPLQVHCDAAGISRHWLITAGSCLSRHHKKPGGTGRSAFVTYCGDVWWKPERVAYVKYSVVHPRYLSSDETMRHLYNIGLIQVVTSMDSACSGWSPISLMSYQLVADEGGSTASAIGWGLDRFDTQNPSIDLPRWPLSIYKSQVYSDSCPGNFQYSKVKRLDDVGGTNNVYCLALPPYLKEENDPIHGTLLMVGGKLIALYLEEERRPWGEQCAQYTGIWRLLPWVMDVAHEPDEIDPFDI